MVGCYHTIFKVSKTAFESKKNEKITKSVSNFRKIDSCFKRFIMMAVRRKKPGQKRGKEKWDQYLKQ